MNKAEIALMDRKKRRRISAEDVQGIADLCAIRLTEKEACCHLGIDYETWRIWKVRDGNLGAFASTLSRVRSAKIRGLVSEIEKHGHGDKKRGIRADWRALDRVLTITDQRYSDRAPGLPMVETDALADSLLSRMLERAYQSRGAPAIEVADIKTSDEADIGSGI